MVSAVPAIGKDLGSSPGSGEVIFTPGAFHIYDGAIRASAFDVYLYTDIHNSKYYTASAKRECNPKSIFQVDLNEQLITIGLPRFGFNFNWILMIDK